MPGSVTEEKTDRHTRSDARCKQSLGETGNQELLQRATHQAYKIIDNERSSKSGTQMENLVAMLWMGGKERKKKSKARKREKGRKLGSGRSAKEWSGGWFAEWAKWVKMHHQF